MAVLAVGSHDRVLRPEHIDHAHRARLFADPEVHEPSDGAGAVELHAAFLEAADAEHLPQQRPRP
jgi:hypothetical protein